MLCQNCGKYEATTHIKKVINGEAGESHLCSRCAAELGYNDFFGDFGLGISDIFTGFFGDIRPAMPGRLYRCEECGCSFDDIVKTGKVGCARCYEKFYDKLLPSVQRIHGRARHSGKVPHGYVRSSEEEQSRKRADEPEQPSRTQGGEQTASSVKADGTPAAAKRTEEKKNPATLTVQEKIERAEQKMAKAISEQNFELAAQLRDEIKELKGGQEG